jgi:uncharacterized FlaG/YvyC family protein
MNVTLDPQQNLSAADTTAPSPKTQAVRQSAPRPATTAAANSSATPIVTSQPSVTFRKDPAGKIYYVVTDPQSGKEIRQVPADAVRKAAEGIDEFLKQQEAAHASHIEVKA